MVYLVYPRRGWRVGGGGEGSRSVCPIESARRRRLFAELHNAPSRVKWPRSSFDAHPNFPRFFRPYGSFVFTLTVEILAVDSAGWVNYRLKSEGRGRRGAGENAEGNKGGERKRGDVRREDAWRWISDAKIPLKMDGISRRL